MFHRRCFLLAIAALLLTTPAATQAGDYAYDLPQLVGHYLGDMPSSPTIELAVDLGMPFAEINGATLQLQGNHTPGLYGYLSFGGVFQAPAEVIASIPQLSFSKAHADEQLPLPGGEFDLAVPWRKSGSNPYPPDLTAWKDGTAEFRFSVGGPILIAITYQIAPPDVTINSATLIIHGQPELDAFMLPGDFNGDRIVDAADLDVWEATSGDGSEFLTWQRNVGAEAPPPPAAAVPEPAALPLLMACLLAARQRRDSAIMPIHRPAIPQRVGHERRHQNPLDYRTGRSASRR